MDGNEAYKLQWQKRIDKTLADNKDKPYLRGFNNALNVSISSRYAYLRNIVKFMNFCQKDVEDLEYDDYTAFLKSKEEMTANYMTGLYASLVNFSAYLFDSGKAKTDIMVRIKKPRIKESKETIEKRENGYLTQEEIQKLVDAVYKGVKKKNKTCRKMAERDIALVLLPLVTGIRESEIYKLNVDDVDLENRTITINRKGGIVKTLYMDDKLFDAMDGWIECRPDYLSDGHTEDALFISWTTEGRLCQQSISKIIKQYTNVCTDKVMSPHRLRATCGTQLYNETGDIYLVQEFLDHKNIETTKRYIRGTNSDNKRKGSKIMGSMFTIPD